MPCENRICGIVVREVKPVRAASKFTAIGMAFRIMRGPKRSTGWMVVCRCDCGAIAVLPESVLVTAKHKSCRMCVDNTTHGCERHKLYPTWRGMMTRCYDVRCPAYPNYGGRGIRVADRWHDVRAFIDDMGKRPEGCTLERIDNNDSYSPSNCRWATRTEQQRNKRNSRFIEVNGVMATVAEWSEKSGIGYDTILERLKRGWDAERAVTYPPHLYHAGKQRKCEL